MIRMFQTQFKSISAKIAVSIFAASAVPLIIGLGIINSNAYTQAQRQIEHQLIQLVTSREHLLREHIDNIQHYAASTANLPSVVKMLEMGDAIDEQTLVAAAADMTSMQASIWGQTHHIFLADTQGTVVFSPPYPGWKHPDQIPDKILETQSPHLGESIADAEYFQEALLGPRVSGFFAFSERDHFHQLAMHPVRNEEGRSIGAVVIEIDIQTTLGLLRDDFSLGRTGKLFLSTDTGELVVHKKTDASGTPILNQGLMDSVKQKRITFGRFTHDQHDVHGIYLPSTIYPWVVCIEIDHNEVMQSAQAQRQHFAIVGAVILMVCGLTAIMIARVFGKPIKALVKSANAVADGDFFREIAITRVDEIGQLQNAVNDMRYSLKQQIDHLDNTVIERTEQLTALNEQLKHDSDHDKLTRLPNRNLFCRRLEDEIAAYRADNERMISVLFFDFDRFKLVNDSLGHAAGDSLLCSIAERFNQNLRKTDLSARFGGDEFVVLLSPIESETHAIEAAHRLLKLFEQPHNLNGHEITSTASIGIVIADPRYTSAGEMIRDADAAMYQAKLDGKGRVVRFDQQMLENAKLRLRLEEDLNKAIQLNQLRVAYQPIINLETLKTTGFEALLRWEHPELGWIQPDQFIDMAEDTGQIVQIGEWVTEQAVTHIQEWNSRFKFASSLSVNVNVSKRQLIDDGFLPHLRAVLRSSGINPAQLKIEITESTIVDSRTGEGMGEIFDAIRALGVQIAMDDFGTGHSSLSLLHKYKFDVLKIDQSFIRDMELNRDIGAVLHATIELAKNTGMSIVAEGVETESQVTALLAHGCDMVQGYYFAKPMFSDDVVYFLAQPEIYSSAA